MIAVKIALVVSLACVAAAVLRRASASLRHGVLACGFLIAAALPALELVAPGWGTDVVPAVPGLAAANFAPERQWLAIIWLAGAAIGLLSLGAGLARIAWLRASARRVVNPQWRRMADEAAAECGVFREVTLLETHRGSMPITWGVLRPKILLPESARAWNEDCLRTVLRHELAHVRRGDWAVQLASSILTRACWPNPILWIAARWLRIESERACDDAVLNLGVDGADYAGHLVTVARSVSGVRVPWRVAPAAAHASALRRRITATLDRQIDRAPLSPCAAVVTALLLTAASVPIAGFGRPASPETGSLLGVQRDVLSRFGGEERRFSIVSEDISFRKTRIEGRVELQARLNLDGSVSGVRIMEPVHPDLARAAEVIVRHWRREPARVRGVAVEVPIRMTVDFRR